MRAKHQLEGAEHRQKSIETKNICFLEELTLKDVLHTFLPNWILHLTLLSSGIRKINMIQ